MQLTRNVPASNAFTPCIGCIPFFCVCFNLVRDREVLFNYDSVNDVGYFGIRTSCITGDVDCNGNPGANRLAVFGPVIVHPTLLLPVCAGKLCPCKVE